jgi:hypothetical protein
MNSLRRLVVDIRMRLGASRAVASEGNQDGKKNDLKLTDEQVEELRKGTSALYTSSIHP